MKLAAYINEFSDRTSDQAVFHCVEIHIACELRASDSVIAHLVSPVERMPDKCIAYYRETEPGRGKAECARKLVQFVYRLDSDPVLFENIIASAARVEAFLEKYEGLITEHAYIAEISLAVAEVSACSYIIVCIGMR